MTHTMKRGDRLPPLVATLGHAGAEPLDLSTATVRFVMKQRRGPVVIERTLPPAAITDQTATVDWQPGDTDMAGVYRAEFEVTWSNGLTATFPNADHLLVEIVHDLGGTVPSST
jgi:hypothetical protein